MVLLAYELWIEPLALVGGIAFELGDGANNEVTALDMNLDPYMTFLYAIDHLWRLVGNTISGCTRDVITILAIFYKPTYVAYARIGAIRGNEVPRPYYLVMVRRYCYVLRRATPPPTWDEFAPLTSNVFTECLATVLCGDLLGSTMFTTTTT